VAKRRGHATAESLEALEERAAQKVARKEDDEEVALADLIEAMAVAEPGEREDMPQERTGNEFTCSSCHLIYLADEDRLMCIDCVRGGSQRRARGRPARRRITVEAPCPACGEILMVPEREDAAWLFCPGCGVHVLQWGGHLHLGWNHRYTPEHLPRQQDKPA
jgi:DNA-directed RNA polymerase subunit M/transcription elongation factor TFIIS